MTFELKYYLRIFQIRFLLFLSVCLIVVAAGAALAIKLPKVYRAYAEILVEGSQIPTDLAKSTVQTGAGEHLQVIQQRLMSRDSLMQIADRFDLYADSPEMEPDEILSGMRERITVQVLGGRDQATRMQIAASAGQPQAAAAIANDLLNQVLSADAEFRTEVATDTLAFFENEVKRLAGELDAMDARILEFQNANVGALPETLDFRLNRQGLLQERLGQAQRELDQLADQRVRLVKVFEATGRTETVSTIPPTPEQQELDALRGELRRALAVFSDSNPKVRVLQARVEQLEQLVAGRRTEEPAPVEERPGEAVLEAQLAGIDSKVADLTETSERLEVQITELQDSIDRTPANGITLSALERDRNNIQGQYNAAVERLSAAATGERIELLSKGQRLSVVERAVVPTSPAEPNRKLIAAAAGGLGVALGLAAVIASELLRPYIRRPVELTRSLGITPLATVPYLETPGEIWRRRGTRMAWRMAVVVALAIGAGFISVNRNLLALDEVAQEIREKVRL